MASVDTPHRLEASVGRHWALVTGAALGLVGLAILYLPVLARLVEQWSSDENYSYGFLVLPFCLWLIHRRRAALRHLPLAPANAGLLWIGGALALLLLGRLGAELFLTRISLLVMLIGLTLALAGRAWLRALAFPLGFLAFMIPLPALLFNLITLPMQSWATRLGVSLVSWTGLPVLREGNLILLPQVALNVVTACSGIRSLLALIALATGYGYLTESRASGRWLLVAAMLPLAILSNGCRIALTILLGLRYGATATQGVWHFLTGMQVFLFSIFGLILIQRGLHRVWRGAIP